MTDQKLNLNINLGEIRYLEVGLLITKQFMIQKLKTTDPIDWMKFISTEVFAVTDRKTGHVKIPYYFGLVK